MKPFDPALASPFRIDWLTDLEDVERDDYTRAVAEKADAILRSARFIAEHQVAGARTDMEIRVWVEAATSPACLSITFEPGLQAFGFHLLDESLRERLACVVFRDLPCIDGEASAEQAGDILRAMAQTLSGAPAVRVSVLDAASVDTGVEP